jgi:predicted secreted protein
LYISYNFEVLHKLKAEVANHLQTLYINFYVEPNTLSATPVAQQFQDNISSPAQLLLFFFFNPVSAA